ncbi:class I SAM-dependent methyltransferase [Streptomyces sp. NPDC050564]|uniref:class I SAM-dependent methyltransferase n=1 Tax=Streptomyces sp. NPDC050564 TaxID=3365631 RepID=UPI0037B792C4
MSTEETTTIYGREEFKRVDVGAAMRDGHPDISDGDQLIVDLVAKKRETAGRPLTVIDVGSGSGVLSELLAQRLPDCRVVANEIAANPARQARERLAGHPNAEVFTDSFVDWREPLDIIISWGSHHHLPHSHLQHARELLGESGSFVLGDEFCPEYCTPEDVRRLKGADVIELGGGHLLAGHEEIEAYAKDGTVPEWSRVLEDRRRRTLWNWYKFVIDYAIERDHWPVAIAEMQITKDDMVTAFEEEHKLSPLIVEHELAVNGFEQISKHVIGDRPAELQSFFIYEFVPGNDRSNDGTDGSNGDGRGNGGH